MTANDAFVVYKKITDEIQATQIPVTRYINFQLKDQRKLQIYQTLVDSGVNVEKFFLANCILSKDFYIDYYKYNPDKCMTLYYSWDEFLVKKRTEYFRRIIAELKKGYKLDLNDRDKFLELLPITDYLFFSALYPEILELLLSLDDDWVKFNLPEFGYKMDFIRKVIKGSLVLQRMQSYGKLREKVLRVIQ